ncbi:hypothetical protein COLO4_15144 [Corchorus olitorius]|uniref:Agenet domain-containing protein n=1 Tax=Corchorus olitorius TaxID=93759 RepID=A0A1R3JP85_9ROSI|nr:hypothetical protein COLO4_15144 [Corchorus olitorius]
MRVFRVGDKVEVCSTEEGFVGSYYEATIVSILKDGSYKVRYKNLVEEEDDSKLLVEKASADEVRPMPPRIQGKGTRFYSYLDKVDAFDNDGWWVGIVTGIDGFKYSVYFESSRDEIAYPVSRLRRHLEWSSDGWVFT